ncbi:TIGR01244 family sulfur transferase [Altericroceibacterium xinjiangense]|uniref:TIGR01244 family sulfur transferase n=1 Tax=Altericroceibacterium xinjiangense TaxID=762261 RepID=UPI000F7DA638|nr:TIGR01244 family sulfur transferase [Altericroceibacterium xinjiangense]
MNDFRKLSELVFASPQITVDDVDEAKRLGIRLIVNNRPEGEAPDQTPGHVIKTAAEKIGLDYLAIPISHTGFTESQVSSMAVALRETRGPVLAYCRSGTRSTFLWSLAQAKMGADPTELTSAARQAGYDITSIRPILDNIAGGD